MPAFTTKLSAFALLAALVGFQAAVDAKPFGFPTFPAPLPLPTADVPLNLTSDFPGALNASGLPALDEISSVAFKRVRIRVSYRST